MNIAGLLFLALAVLGMAGPVIAGVYLALRLNGRRGAIPTTIPR